MTKNTVSGLFAFVLGAAYLASTLLLPEVTAGDEVGPKLFPVIVSVVMMLSGGALVAVDRKERAGKSGEAFSLRFVQERDVWTRIALTMVCGIAYGMVLDWLGYVIATILFMFAVAWVIDVRRHVENAIISSSCCMVSCGVFGMLLKLSLPRGLLGFLPL